MPAAWQAVTPRYPTVSPSPGTAGPNSTPCVGPAASSPLPFCRSSTPRPPRGAIRVSAEDPHPSVGVLELTVGTQRDAGQPTPGYPGDAGNPIPDRSAHGATGAACQPGKSRARGG